MLNAERVTARVRLPTREPGFGIRRSAFVINV
jgi:hypothetical protein